MAEIQLKQNWSGYVPGTIKQVSSVRAKYLVDEGIARYTPAQREKDAKEPTKASKALEVKLAKYKEEYDALVAKGAERTPEETERGTKLEELIKETEQKLKEA